MPFWSETYRGTDMDPKRNFRFSVQLTNVDSGNIIWWAKEVSKPSFTVNVAEHSYLNHKFKFPGTVTWNDIELTVVDPQEPHAAALLSQLWTDSGYQAPTDPGSGTSAMATVSKGQAVSALGDVVITQFDAAGTALETWTLKNGFCKGITYGDTIAYGNDELTTYKLSMAYDFAKLEVRTGGGPFFSS